MIDKVTRTIGSARRTLLSCAGLLALAGCGHGTVQEALGMGKRSPDEFAVRLAAEQKKWGEVIRKRGMKAE